MSWFLILVLWAFAGGLGYGLAKASKEGKGIGSNELFPDGNDDFDSKKHWTEYVTDEEDEDEERPRHWTEYVHDDDSRDRDDDWEWDRQDDFGDSWDSES